LRILRCSYVLVRWSHDRPMSGQKLEAPLANDVACAEFLAKER
jgi:hypothetical protein